MSPDPYRGSYDFTNPQTFNRYSYVQNNPLSMTDPSGQVGCLALLAAGGETANPIGIGAGIAGCVLDILGLANFFESLFGGRAFHGTLFFRTTGASSKYGAGFCSTLNTFQRAKRGCFYACEATFGPNLTDEAFGLLYFPYAQISAACKLQWKSSCPYSITIETNHPGLQIPGDVNITSCNGMPYGPIEP
jgi:hypothetical protein